MSTMRINYVTHCLKDLKLVIEELINNYTNSYEHYNSVYKEAEMNLIENEKNSEEIGESLHFTNTQLELYAHKKPMNTLKNLAQTQNELMLVKHAALIENMLIELFRSLTQFEGREDYFENYFSEDKKLSDSYLAANKINELTDKAINVKKLQFWYLYETIRTMRNSIAHGDPLFILRYSRIQKFNKSINMIKNEREINNGRIKHLYPTLIHPTFASDSKWYCCLSSDLEHALELNNKCLEFVREIRELYLSYGYKNRLTDHELYAGKPFSKWREQI